MTLFLPTNFKRIMMYIFVDFVFTLFSVYISFLLRFDFSIPAQYNLDILKAWLILFGIRVVVFSYFSLYKVSWRYFGFRDNIRLIYLLILSTMIFISLLYLFRNSLFLGFPRSVIPIEFFIALFLFSFFRISKRYVLEVFNKNALGKPTLIVASTQKAEEITRNLIKNSTDFFPVVIYNDEAKGTKINGVDVFDFEKILSVYDGLKVAIVSDDIDLKNIYEKLKQLNITTIKKYHSIEDVRLNLKDISIEDLLARSPKDLDKNAIKEFIKDKTILITGAGGSIGSELSRQCINFGAKKLLLLDHSEYNLYKIEQELQDKNIVPILQSVVDRKVLEKTFKNYDIDILLHAAAYKHVPLVEENVEEAILNNIIGTKNCMDFAVKYGVKKFVMISTDKAVRPTNVMGATKRVCELYGQNLNSKSTEIVSVRFGNVLGSSGSVIPKFKKQIENGGPLTVTHPNITRYFMLIPEACQLVLQAASIGKGGELFILDMGEPVKIVDLAYKMIELSGRGDIKIEFIGLRKGEKLYEELLIDEANKKTQYNSIMIAKPTNYDIELLQNQIEKLLIDEDKISVLRQIVPEFKHNII